MDKIVLSAITLSADDPWDLGFPSHRKDAAMERTRVCRYSRQASGLRGIAFRPAVFRHCGFFIDFHSIFSTIPLEPVELSMFTYQKKPTKILSKDEMNVVWHRKKGFADISFSRDGQKLSFAKQYDFFFPVWSEEHIETLARTIAAACGLRVSTFRTSEGDKEYHTFVFHDETA
ncbi:MAG: hypothetical protein Q7S15_01720 [bacterium]|nr:hypothetical protein [bacterium]